MGRPSDKEIEDKTNSIYDKQRKLYRRYKLKSFFGAATTGLNENNALVLSAILQHNKNDAFSFVVINNIDNTDAEYIRDYHKKALRIDDKDYVSIFFNTDKNFGDFVLGDNIANKLTVDVAKKFANNFKKQVNRQRYIKATEDLIKGINRQLANA